MKIVQRAARIAAAAVLLAAVSPAAAQSLIGTFQTTLANEVQSATLQLLCKSEKSCVFTYTSQETGGEPNSERKSLNVQPLKDRREVDGAFGYALDHKGEEIVDNTEFIEIMKQLRPILDDGPAIGKCWDLNYVEPTYMVACYVSQKSSKRPTLFLFGTLMADCGEAFCRYIIYPMQRVK